MSGDFIGRDNSEVEIMFGNEGARIQGNFKWGGAQEWNTNTKETSSDWAAWYPWNMKNKWIEAQQWNTNAKETSSDWAAWYPWNVKKEGLAEKGDERPRNRKGCLVLVQEKTFSVDPKHPTTFQISPRIKAQS